MVTHECMNAGDGACAGQVVLRFSQMGTPNPRCARHQAKRDELEEHIRELESPFPPSDFSEGDAGESWGDDY